MLDLLFFDLNDLRLLDLEKMVSKKSIHNVAGALGFEPRMQVPKTRALPLGYAPI